MDSGVMKGWGVGQCPTPTEPTQLMNGGKSDVRDAVEEGQLRVGGEKPQVIPPLSSGGLPPKGERRMVSLRIYGREVLSERNPLHAGPWGNGY